MSKCRDLLKNDFSKISPPCLHYIEEALLYWGGGGSGSAEKNLFFNISHSQCSFMIYNSFFCTYICERVNVLDTHTHIEYISETLVSTHKTEVLEQMTCLMCIIFIYIDIHTYIFTRTQHSHM